jgi:anti-sigma regulatory factor (Ser/Thr protein kinase)
MIKRALGESRSTVIAIPPSRSGIERAAGAYLACAARYAVPDDVRADMYVALEEITSNVVRHATRASRIDITFTVTAEALQIDINDNGEPFDPFSMPSPDVTQALGERPLGGLGVFLVRQLTDSSYERRGGINRVRLRRLLGGDGAGRTPPSPAL